MSSLIEQSSLSATMVKLFLKKSVLEKKKTLTEEDTATLKQLDAEMKECEEALVQSLPSGLASTLLKLEAIYTSLLERPPTAETKAEIAKMQVLIDDMRMYQRMPLLWYTEEEMVPVGSDSENWDTEPRTPLAVWETFWGPTKPLALNGRIPVPQLTPTPDLPTKVSSVSQYPTLTLDALLAQLHEVRKTHGGQTPVVWFKGAPDMVEEFDSVEDVSVRDGFITLSMGY